MHSDEKVKSLIHEFLEGDIDESQLRQRAGELFPDSVTVETEIQDAIRFAGEVNGAFTLLDDLAARKMDASPASRPPLDDRETLKETGSVVALYFLVGLAAASLIAVLSLNKHWKPSNSGDEPVFVAEEQDGDAPQKRPYPEPKNNGYIPEAIFKQYKLLATTPFPAERIQDMSVQDLAAMLSKACDMDIQISSDSAEERLHASCPEVFPDGVAYRRSCLEMLSLVSSLRIYWHKDGIGIEYKSDHTQGDPFDPTAFINTPIYLEAYYLQNAGRNRKFLSRNGEKKNHGQWQDEKPVSVDEIGEWIRAFTGGDTWDDIAGTMIQEYDITELKDKKSFQSEWTGLKERHFERSPLQDVNDEADSVIVVVQTEETHRQIQKLLVKLDNPFQERSDFFKTCHDLSGSGKVTLSVGSAERVNIIATGLANALNMPVDFSNVKGDHFQEYQSSVLECSNGFDLLREFCRNYDLYWNTYSLGFNQVVEVAELGADRRSKLVLRIFDFKEVAGLYSGYALEKEPITVDDCASLIREFTGGDFWTENEGVAMKVRGSMMLIMQSPDVLIKIEDLLLMLGFVEKGKASEMLELDGGNLFLRAYRPVANAGGFSLDEYAEMIRSQTGGATWKKFDKASVQRRGGMIIVAQTRETHAEIVKLLLSKDALVSK